MNERESGKSHMSSSFTLIQSAPENEMSCSHSSIQGSLNIKT